MLTCCRSGCDRQFKSMAAMDLHYQASHRTFICTKGCLREFKTSLGRMDHEKVAHLLPAPTSSPASQPPATPAIRYSRCRRDGCSRSFPTTEGRDHHEQVAHGVPRIPAKPVTKPAACSDCLKDFASWEHLRQHQSTSVDHTRLTSAPGSLQCGQCERMIRSQYALEQHFVADHPLILIPKNHGEGAQVERNFRQNWPMTPIPKVLFVFKVYNPRWRIRKFKDYKASMPNQGNVVRRYHGTTVQCELGAGVSARPCQDTACALCGIIRLGFKTAKARSGGQRFGPGIYMTDTTSASNNYVGTISPRKAVLVCDVVAGNPFRTKLNMPELRGPPKGYNSVWGEVGMDLDYDEMVVYKSKAILPRYLIIYRI